MRLRPRFSLRTLLVLVTLTCVYFAAWEVTKRKGGADVDIDPDWVHDVYSPMPFVVQSTENLQLKQLKKELSQGTIVFGLFEHRVTYLWFFGWTWETPIRWKVPDNPDDDFLAPDRIHGAVI